MTFTTKPQYWLSTYAILLVLLSTNFSDISYQYFYYFFAGIIFIFSFIIFEFSIEESQLIFKIKLCSYFVYSRVVSHEEISTIKFMRFGFIRGTKVIVKGRMNLRLSRFQMDDSHDLFTELKKYATNHQIATEKTNDFGRL